MANLIFPVDVTIAPIDKATTAYDRRAREPVRQAARLASVVLPAQIQWLTMDKPEAARGGVSERSRGYLVVRPEDIAARSYTPARGDKVTNIPNPFGGVVDVWLDGGFEPAGHKKGKSNLLLLFFMDREPTRVA